MTLDAAAVSRSLRLAGFLLLLGLLTEAISLRWTHPIAFILFVVLGGAFLAGGVLLYLYSLAAANSAADSGTSSERQ